MNLGKPWSVRLTEGLGVEYQGAEEGVNLSPDVVCDRGAQEAQVACFWTSR